MNWRGSGGCITSLCCDANVVTDVLLQWRMRVVMISLESRREKSIDLLIGIVAQAMADGIELVL